MKIHQEKRGTGFTLIEMLVVVAIIGLLAALLFPMLGRGRDRALTTKSMANLRQIHLLFSNYLAGNNDVYPGARLNTTNSYTENERYWSRAVWEYNFGKFAGDPPEVMTAMQNSPYSKVMWCPLMVKRYGQDQHPIGRTSYSMNWYFADTSGGGGIRREGNQGLKGNKEPFLVTGVPHGGDARFGTYAQFRSSMFPYDYSWENVAYEYGDHDAALGLYLDGHSRLIPQADGIAMNALIVDQGSLE